MKIWMLTTTGTPQHIGNTKGDSHMEVIVHKARKARFAVRSGAFGIQPDGTTRAYLFDTQEHFQDFASRNPDIRFFDQVHVSKEAA